jgi:hypothetical protein
MTLNGHFWYYSSDLLLRLSLGRARSPGTALVSELECELGFPLAHVLAGFVVINLQTATPPLAIGRGGDVPRQALLRSPIKQRPGDRCATGSRTALIAAYGCSVRWTIPGCAAISASVSLTPSSGRRWARREVFGVI